MQAPRCPPAAVVLAAAKVGGIVASDSWPADFLYDNLAIENAIIHGAFETGVEKLLFLGSSCIYPKFAPQPITEDALLSGTLVHDTSKPDGTPRKLMSNAMLAAMGCQPRIGLKDGLIATYQWFVEEGLGGN